MAAGHISLVDDLKGFDRASDVRQALMKMENKDEILRFLKNMPEAQAMEG